MPVENVSQRDPLEAAMSQAAERLRQGDSSSESIPTTDEALSSDLKKLLPLVNVLEQWKSQREYASALNPARETTLGDNVGPFRLHRRIGSGGMAIVFEATQEAIRRPVALKMLPWRIAHKRGVKERFLREARTAAALQHPQIVPIYNCGEHEGLPYYSMRLVCGAGLDQAISMLGSDRTVTAGQIYRIFAQGGREPRGESPKSWARFLSSASETAGSPTVASQLAAPENPERVVLCRRDWRRVVEIIARAAHALAQAHRRGIWHRDVKPGNLLLDVGGKVWITDFGLAMSQLEETPVGTSSLAGTLRYMPPEAFARQTVGPAGDVYSLGLTLYELCTLKPAFADPDSSKLIRQIRQGQIPEPRKLCRKIPRELERVIQNATATTAEDRYPSMKAFLADLVALARGSLT